MSSRIAIFATVVLLAGAAAYGMYVLRAPKEDLALASADATARFIASQQPLKNPRQAPEGWAEYHNLALHFSIFYPAAMGKTEYYEDSGAYTVLFTDDSQGRDFQIFARPYGKAQITQEQFLLDEPSGVRENPVGISIDSIPAQKFYSKNNAMGDSVEVWFIHGGYLFEVTTYKEDDARLSQIINTWKFI